MGFSFTPKEAAKEIDVLLDIANKLSILVDKDALADTIRFAHGLTESEQVAAEHARSQIVQYQGMLDEHEKKKALLDALEKSLEDDKNKQNDELEKANEILDNKRAKNEELLAAIEISKRDMKAATNDLKSKESELEKRERQYAISNQSLEVEKENLRKAENDLAIRKQQVDEYEALLKNKVAQLQKLTGGL